MKRVDQSTLKNRLSKVKMRALLLNGTKIKLFPSYKMKQMPENSSPKLTKSLDGPIHFCHFWRWLYTLVITWITKLIATVHSLSSSLKIWMACPRQCSTESLTIVFNQVMFSLIRCYSKERGPQWSASKMIMGTLDLSWEISKKPLKEPVGKLRLMILLQVSSTLLDFRKAAFLPGILLRNVTCRVKLETLWPWVPRIWVSMPSRQTMAKMLAKFLTQLPKKLYILTSCKIWSPPPATSEMLQTLRTMKSTQSSCPN